MADRSFIDEDNLFTRQLATGDLEQFRQLVADAKSLTEPADAWIPYEGEELDSLIDSSHTIGLGLFEGDRLVGTAFLVKDRTLLHGSDDMRLSGLPEKGTAEITHVILDSDWRGEGLAAGLVDQLVKAAASIRSVKRIYALVSHYDMQGRKLFERSHFASCSGVDLGNRHMIVYQLWFETKDD